MYLNGYYYGCSKADSTKLLKSNNLTDWTVACDMPVPNTNHAAVNRYVPILQPTGFDNGIIAYTEFLGNGTTWKAGRMNNYMPNFCGAFSFKFKDMFVTITNDAEVRHSDIHHSYDAYSRLYVAATYNNTNRVIGHTLYLR